MIRLGKGIFTWEGAERRSNRYGSFSLWETDYASTASCVVEWASDAAKALASKKVRLFAHILEVRESGHIGDLFLSIFPSTPDVGEIIEIGIGTFIPGEGIYLVTLQPSDGRGDLWIDPRILYRLHDQTVEIFAEETDLDEYPRPDLSVSEGARSCGDGDVQVRGEQYSSGVAIRPTILQLGDGLFEIRPVDISAMKKGEIIADAVPSKNGNSGQNGL